MGEAVGDALGYPVEFSPQTPDSPVVFDLLPRNVGPLGEQWAHYSDDTQMTRSVAEGLITGNGDFDRSTQAVATEFMRWLDGPPGGHRAPGGACTFGCDQLKRGVRWDLAGKPEPTGGGCGAAMRSAPYGWLHHLDPVQASKWAAAHAQMTHNTAIGRASAAATAVAVSTALRGQSPAVVAYNAMRAATYYDQMTGRMIAEAAFFALSNVRTSTQVLNQLRGWAGHEAIAASIYCFLQHPKDFEKAVLLAVNSPGDSDSLGAITGAIAGASLGISSIPSQWVDRIERRAELYSLAERFMVLVKEEPARIEASPT